jgi:hypothetical protein
MRSQEAAAMEVLVGKTLTGWNCLNLASLADLAHTQPGICVVDLPGLGLHRTSETAAAALQQALANQAAIVLYRSQEGGWSEPDSGDASASCQRWVPKPVSASVMRDALEWAVKNGIPKPVVKVAPEPAAAPPAAPATTEPAEHNELTAEEFAAQLARLESGRPTLFLRKLAEALESQGSFEIRLTLQNCLLVCPQEHWIASNTPMAVVHRLAASDALAAVAQIYPIEGDAGRLLSRHSNMAIQPLDTFLWHLLNPTSPGPAV